MAAVTCGGACAPGMGVAASALAAADLGEGFARDAELDAFRALPGAEPCRTCTLRDVCRGGCRVVATHLGAPLASPDPECPRVRAHLPVDVG